ncbi:hypothetical protein Tco_0111428 [Tanacetum coccineum]
MCDTHVLWIDFDKFAAKEGESLESVYERLTTLVNIIDRNNVRPISVSINTKFLNCLQPEWGKYVTNGYGGNGNKNAGRQNRNQAFNVGTGSDESNQIIQRVPRTKSTTGKANKDEAGSNLNDEEKDFMLDNSYGEETMEDLTVAVILMARFQPADGNAETVAINMMLSFHESQCYIQVGLGYKNPERLKKAIAAQLKMYDGEMLHSAKLKFYSLDSEETLEDAKESRLKMRNKMVQINYGKLNTLYETFVPQQEFSVEQTYFSIPSTFNNGSESKEVTPDLPIPKMPKEKQKVNERSSKENILQNEIDRLLEVSLTSEIQNCVLISVEKQKNKLLKDEFGKSSSNSKDIQANLLKRIKILENDFKRSQAQSIDFELKLQHQREKMACDVSWKSKLSTLNDENVLLKTQVDSVVQERENIKLKFQKLFNSIKATRTQNKKEVDELIEHANQKTYAYADARAQNQDLLMTISELKNKLRTTEKGKNMNTKFDKSETLGKSVCVTPFNKNIAYKAKNMKNTKVNADRITKTETQSPDSKSKMNVSNSTCVESSNSIRRPKSKDTKSNDRVLKNNNDKRPSTHVRKMSSSVSIDSNKRETMHSNVCQSNASVLSTKTINAVNDSSNIVCVSCGKDVLLLSHEKCVAHYGLSRNSNVKRALFTTHTTAKSMTLGATSIVVKSRLSVAKTPTATNKVSSVLPLSPDSSQSKTLSNYIKNKITTSRKLQKWFEYQQSFNWTPKSKTAQSLPSETKSRIRVYSKSNTQVTTQKWVAKLSTLPSAFVSCDASDSACPLDC